MTDRRDLLRGAAAFAAMQFLGARAHAREPGRPPRLATDPFALGVASGDPTPTGMVLWTRVVGIPGDSAPAFEVALDEGFRRIVRAGRTVAPAANAGAVHLELDGLEPGRPYFYRFHLAGATSRVGRTATVPLAPRRARFALTSCQHWEQGWFSGYRDMIAQAPDAVLQVGDYIYEKSFGHGPDVRSFGVSDPVTLTDYRARHALYRTDRDLADAHAALPFVVTWDDHEVENDYAGAAGVATGNPSAFLRRRIAAYRAYFEHMPIAPGRLRANGEVELYRRLDWGDLATLHVLDTRQYRSPHPCATEAEAERGGRAVVACPAARDPQATMLGRAQEAWLAGGLARERARWSLVTQQTLFARLHLPAGPDAFYSDIWDGYPGARERMIGALARHPVRNPVILGGDVHSFWVNDVWRDADRPETQVVATEIVTTCLASRNGPSELFGPARALNPHVRFLDNDHAGYALIDVTPRQLSVDLRAVEDRADPASACHSLARYAIEDGRPGTQA